MATTPGVIRGKGQKMKYEKCIDILKERFKYTKTYKYTDEEIKEAQDMVINLLETQITSRAEAVKRNYNQVNQEIMEATGCRSATTAQGFEIVNGIKISQSLINIDITLAELLDTIRAKDHEEEDGIAIGYHIDHYTPITAEWLRTFDTDSATECFNAVQELKKIIEEEA